MCEKYSCYRDTLADDTKLLMQFDKLLTVLLKTKYVG
jgi:hypothetical protein